MASNHCGSHSVLPFVPSLTFLLQMLRDVERQSEILLAIKEEQALEKEENQGRKSADSVPQYMGKPWLLTYRSLLSHAKQNCTYSIHACHTAMKDTEALSGPWQ